MAIPATQARVGMVILHNGQLCRIVNVDHVTPGKGRGMVQAKMVSLEKGTNVVYRFRSGEKIEPQRVEEKEMEYLYRDPSGYVFMDVDTYEQITIPENLSLGINRFMKENTRCKIEFFEDHPIGVQVPLAVDLAITHTEPRLKSATATARSKPATLETGLVVQVPEFLEIGEVIRIDTRDSKYLERAKSR